MIAALPARLTANLFVRPSRRERRVAPLTVIVLVVGVTLAVGSIAPADDPPRLDSVARLHALGRPTPGLVGSLVVAGGPVTAVDDRLITIRGWFGAGFRNMKEEDESGADRYGRQVRRDPTKPIVLSYTGWEVDCLSIRFTPEGMAVTLVTGQEVVLRDADRPTRRFSATAELLRGAPHPRIPDQQHHCHTLREVRVGDEVSLYLDGELGKEECAGVTIRRRPGSRVPHSTLHPEFFRDMIDRFNAYQGHEQDGAPIPDRFRRDLQRIREEAFLRGEEAVDPPPPPKRP